jgi:shikimate dehydrogenase
VTTALAFGVLGDPVSHSRSPAMHAAAFAALGLPHRYYAFRVAPQALPAALAGARALGLGGLNLTVPHKHAAAALCDELGPEAARIGAVNTVCVEGSRLVGRNTDGAGFLAGLRELPGGEPGSAVVLGGGGAARAVVDALAHEARAEVAWVSRAPAELPPGPWQPLGYEALAERLATADLLVNATIVGMHGGPASFPVPVPVERLPAGARVVDLVYSSGAAPGGPWPMPVEGLVARAAACGLPAQDGLPMLLWQGVRALEEWLAMSLSPGVVGAMRAAIGG